MFTRNSSRFSSRQQANSVRLALCMEKLAATIECKASSRCTLPFSLRLTINETLPNESEGYPLSPKFHLSLKYFSNNILELDFFSPRKVIGFPLTGANYFRARRERQREGGERRNNERIMLRCDGGETRFSTISSRFNWHAIYNGGKKKKKKNAKIVVGPSKRGT